MSLTVVLVLFQTVEACWTGPAHWLAAQRTLSKSHLSTLTDLVKLHGAFGKCALLLRHRGHELGSLFTSLNESLNHLNTSFTFDKEKRFCVDSAVTNVFLWPRPPTARPRGCWVRLWSSVVMAQASTVTWTATARSNKSLSPPTKSA